MKTAVSNVAPGQVVKFHGEPCIVLEHRTAGTLLVTARPGLRALLAPPTTLLPALSVSTSTVPLWMP